MSLVNQFGRPIRPLGLYPLPSRSATEQRPRPNLRPRTYENVTSWQRAELVNFSRVIRAGVPNIDAALTMQMDFAFSDAWQVKYKGSQRQWGRQMEAHINDEFYRNCNVLGEAHDFYSTLKNFGIAMKVDGDQAAIFDPDTGRVLIIPGTRIGTGTNTKVQPSGKSRWGEVQIIDDPASQFNGQRIVDGVIVDKNFVRIGVRVLGQDDDGNETFTDLPASSCRLDFQPKWSDQLRGIPDLATAILPVIKVEDFDYYIKQAMILSASMAVARKSREGAPSPAARLGEETVWNPDGTTSTRPIAVQEVTAGIQELSTENEEELTTLNFNRPSMNEEAFIERVETGFFAKLWPRALIYHADFGRAGGRSVAQQVRQIVWNTQQAAEKFARWLINNRIAWAMSNGRIPPNNAQFDAYNYEFSMPAEFTIDEANDAKIDLEKLKRGATTRRVIAAKDGRNLDDVDAARFAEEDALMAKAEALAAKHSWLTPKEALSRLDEPAANPQVSNAPAQPATQPTP